MKIVQFCIFAHTEADDKQNKQTEKNDTRFVARDSEISEFVSVQLNSTFAIRTSGRPCASTVSTMSVVPSEQTTQQLKLQLSELLRAHTNSILFSVGRHVLSLRTAHKAKAVILLLFFKCINAIIYTHQSTDCKMKRLSLQIAAMHNHSRRRQMSLTKENALFPNTHNSVYSRRTTHRPNPEPHSMQNIRNIQSRLVTLYRISLSPS